METLIFDYNEVFKGPRAQDMREFLELRFRVFVQGLGWSLPSRDGMESDQYDNPNCTYILVKRSGRVVAGARIIPSCQDWFGQTNLLRDAAKGRITSIAPDLFPSDYDFADSYECSRLSVDVDQLSNLEVAQVFKHLGQAFAQVAQERGFRTYLSLSPPALLRKFRALGFDVSTVGEKYICQDDGRRYLVLSLSNFQAIAA
jgi:acyl homoserine lactone synthase